MAPQSNAPTMAPARSLARRGKGVRGAVAATLIALSVLAGARPSAALPYQLLEAPSAVLIRRGGQEMKADYGHEVDQIPTESLLLHYRYGLTPRLEVSGGAVLARFTDQDEQRLAELQATIKYHLAKKLFQHDLVTYGRYRAALGDPVIVQTHGGPGNVDSVVSRHADGGRDTSIGLLGRRQFSTSAYTLGIEYTNAGNRHYGGFTDSQTSVYTLYFSPERHFRGNTVMIALENRYTYWTGRGDFYDALPQVRWEFIKDWVLESGVSIPVIGGRTYRYLVGLTVQY